MLERNSALRGERIHGRFGATGEHPGVTIEEIKEFSCLEICLWDFENAALRSKLSELLGLGELPAPGQSLKLADGRLINMAGDCLLYIGAAGPADILEAAVTAEEGSVVSLSHGRCYLRLGGPEVRELLKRGIRLDLREKAFATGQAALTDIGGIEVLLLKPDAAQYELLISRSRAREFWRWLTKRAAPFSYEVL